MKNREEWLQLLEGKTDSEKKEILREHFTIYYDLFEGARRTFLDNREESCKFWYAQVFDYCNAYELQEELDFFFFLVNLFARIFGFCFNLENTVYLGCTCYCGRNQVILYYSISFNRD